MKNPSKSPDKPVIGVNQPYPNSISGTFELKNTCNEKCHCIPNHFEPVCLDGLTYFSPCYAGCDEVPNEFGNGTIYTNCDCGPTNLIAEPGHCPSEEGFDEDCDKRLKFTLGLMFFACFFIFMIDTGVPLAILRAVKPELKELFPSKA